MIAKVVILCVAVVAVNAYGLVHSGSSASSRHQDGHGNYAFGYDIVDGKGASNSRSEVGDGHGNVKGSYTIHDIDGRARKVEYVADGHGFRAAIKTNEPGTAHSAPAAAIIASPYALPSAPVAVKHVAYAPVVAKAPLAYAASHVVAKAPLAYATGHVVAKAPVYAAHVAAPVYAPAPLYGAYGAYGPHGAYGPGPYGAYGHGVGYGKAYY